MALAAIAAGVAALGASPGTVALAASDTLGKSTVEQRIVASQDPGYRTLTLGPGEPYVVREEDLGTAKENRDRRRTSLVYFGQLSDFQLADEESPARVEFLDPLSDPAPFDAAWRPWEAVEPQIDDQSVRQMNAFSAASPVPGGNGSRARMGFVIDTGDSADSQQLNETRWVRTVLEGGMLDPNSGIDSTSYLHPLCPAGVPGAGEAAGYTGVQDYRDYAEGTDPEFYDPNDPRGEFSGFPSYPNLMDHAQRPFQAAGLTVPSYVAFGNHDALVQGNQAANASVESVATGCLKPMGPVSDPRNLADALGSLTPESLAAMQQSDPDKVALVPPDPARQYVSKAQYRRVFMDGSQADGHGFAYIDPDQLAASNAAAGYYSWSPVAGVRFIALDTVSEGGVAGPSADGNVDDPQLQWLKRQLDDATARDQLVVIFSHHAIESLTADVPDEAAPPCTVPDEHGHDVNPGCDLDPRSSEPIHLGPDLVDLLHAYPHVIAWVAGHSHVNDVRPYRNPSRPGGFWSIRVAAEADWPQQSRLLEVFDDRDGMLSIFGTILDHAASSQAPPPGTDASTLDQHGLASIGRTLSYNDPQKGARECDPACGEGRPGDRNVELLVADPRKKPSKRR